MNQSKTSSRYEWENEFRARFVEDDQNGVRDGVYVEFFETGGVSVVGQFSHGRSSGRWTHFFEAGNIMAIGMMSEDGKEGEWRGFLPSGVVWERIWYKRGVQHGPCEQLDEGGRTIARGEFKDGRPWNGICDEPVFEKQPDGGYSRMGVFKNGRRISDIDQDARG